MFGEDIKDVVLSKGISTAAELCGNLISGRSKPLEEAKIKLDEAKSQNW